MSTSKANWCENKGRFVGRSTKEESAKSSQVLTAIAGVSEFPHEIIRVLHELEYYKTSISIIRHFSFSTLTLKVILNNRVTDLYFLTLFHLSLVQ